MTGRVVNLQIIHTWQQCTVLKKINLLQVEIVVMQMLLFLIELVPNSSATQYIMLSYDDVVRENEWETSDGSMNDFDAFDFDQPNGVNDM